MRGLGRQLNDRTAGQILMKVRTHLLQLDPWASPLH
jgi:hypothetical protein